MSKTRNISTQKYIDFLLNNAPDSEDKQDHLREAKLALREGRTNATIIFTETEYYVMFENPNTANSPIHYDYNWIN